MFQLSSGARNSSLFNDRIDAGEQLAQAVLAEVQRLETPAQFVVYALPRGGIPIALPIAQTLNCPLDVLVAKKITRPDNPELAIGAVTADGHVLRSTDALPEDWQEALERAQTKAAQQLAQFSDRPNLSPRGKIALLVDDGIATGMTIMAAAHALRDQQPQAVWICAPVAPADLVRRLTGSCDRLILLATPERFLSVSRFYRSFPQVELEDAIGALRNFKEIPT